MAIPPVAIGLDNLIIEAFFNGRTAHREIYLDLEPFSARIKSIVEENLGPLTSSDIVGRFFETLHTTDLYLSVACSEAGDLAWQRFNSLYRKHIYSVAAWYRSSPGWARDFTDSFLAELFLPDRTGESRIAGYRGRSSLSCWLAIIVKRRAINENARKSNKDEPLESIPDWVDPVCMERMEALLRARRYGPAIKDSFRDACLSLTESEKLIMRLRYIEGMKAVEIAKLLGESKQSISRQFQSLYGKLKREIESILNTRHNLGEEAVKECIAEMRENPEHSILDLFESD